MPRSNRGRTLNPALARELGRRIVRVHPGLLHPAIGIVGSGIDHCASLIGYYARGVDLVRRVVINLVFLRLVLRQQLVADIDVILNRLVEPVVFGEQPSVIGIDIETPAAGHRRKRLSF